MEKPITNNELPLWTEIHIQPLDLDDTESSKVFWIKHPRVKFTTFDKDLNVATKEFIKLWNIENI